MSRRRQISDDRRFFEANPTRKRFLRYATPDECGAQLTLVSLIPTGTHRRFLRAPVAAEYQADPGMADEAACEQILEMTKRPKRAAIDGSGGV
jgi:hypothetical protein